MFSYQSDINAASFISTERENTLSGIFFENFIASELTAKNHKLFYWKGRSSAELEFCILSSKNPQTLENSIFIVYELALRLSLVLYPFSHVTNSHKSKNKGKGYIF